VQCVLGFLWTKDANTWQGNGGVVEVEHAMELCPCQQAGVDAGAMKKVESQFSLQEEMVPKVDREVFVGAAQASNQVILVGADGPLSSIAVVQEG